MYDHYSGDPYWMTARFGSACRQCGEKISKGSRIYYYPKTKSAFCEQCGQGAYSDFRSAAEDEYAYCHGRNY